MKRLSLLCSAVLAMSVLLVVAHAHAQPCVGDCHGDGAVTIDDIVAGVNIALGNVPLAQCVAADCGSSGVVTIDCLVRAMNGALMGCPVVFCGNGAVEGLEECDDGNADPFDGCTAACTICGNGTVTSPEECDDGNTADADGCRGGCFLNLCGDDARNPAAEACDDGNSSSCDGCSAACQTESGFCGDGVLNGDCELCDDGNSSDTDACRNDCTHRPARFGAGQVVDVAIDPRTPTTLYARTECVGVLKSTDGGETWSAATNGLSAQDPLYLSVYDLAIDPLTPTTLYAAVAQYGGVFKSTDAGATWRETNTGLSNRAIYALAIDPNTPGTVFAAGDGGVFKTTNAGYTWRAANTGLTGGAGRLAIDPNAGTTLYALNFNTGVVRSIDGGDSWQPVDFPGLPLFDPLGRDTLYAVGADSANQQTVFKSTDGGNLWRAADIGFPAELSNINRLVIDPLTAGTLYAGTFAYGVFKSTDGAGSWHAANTGMFGTSADALAVDPVTAGTLYAGRDYGLFKSTDAAATWGLTGLGSDPVCGDGLRCRYEECDDGNLVDGDTCESSCALARCGNGIRDAGERCEDGNPNSCDGCSASCEIEPCGDGVLDSACEACDDGNGSNADACRNDCRLNVCGDGFTNAGIEGCDDGNRASSDGCDANCTPTACGNGIVTPGEECDDGNQQDCDGCTQACELQGCGDGRIECGEECDDGNANPFDGCTGACTTCGDGTITPPEGCEDGNADPADGCTNACTRCGDGAVTPPEVCDDGNLAEGDDCDPSCTTTGCGNGVVQGSEECDDGNAAGGDGCAVNCTQETITTLQLVPGRVENLEIETGTSGIMLQYRLLRIPLPVSGSLTLRTGNARAGSGGGDMPIAVRAEDVDIAPIPVATIVCLCLRAVADPLLGPSNAGAGTIACGANGLAGIDTLVRIDHDISDVDPGCSSGLLEDGSSTGHSPGHPHAGVCNGPEEVTFAGAGPAGSLRLDLRLQSWSIPGLCNVDTANVEKGADGVPCTDDDPRSDAGSASQLLTPALEERNATRPDQAFLVRWAERAGAATNDRDGRASAPGEEFVVGTVGYYGRVDLSLGELVLRLTTGSAAAEIEDVNAVLGDRISVDGTCSPTPCRTEAQRSPLQCPLAEGLTGAALAGAAAVLDTPTLGDVVATFTLSTARQPCAGDCDDDGAVTVAEVVQGVNAALGSIALDHCAFVDTNGDRRVSVDELIAAVTGALNGCES